MSKHRMIFRHPAGSEEVSIWNAVVLPVLKYRRLSYVVVGASVVTTIAICLLLHNQYTSTAVVLPSGGRSPASVLSQAVGSLAEIGIGAGLPLDDNPTASYPEILSSRWMADRILETRFPTYCDSDLQDSTLETYFDVPNRDRAVQRLRSIVRIETDPRFGSTRVVVTTTCAELSAAMAQAYVVALDDWNVNQRRSSAGESMKFIAARLEEKQKELQRAEEELRDFQATNRDYASSGDPDVLLEQARRTRSVEVHTRLYLALTNEYQQARLGAAKDLPIVQVLDTGSVPLEKSGPKRTYYVAGALICSLFLSTLLSVWLDLSDKRRLHDRIRYLSESGMLHPSRTENRLYGALARVGDRLHSFADVQAPVDAVSKDQDAEGEDRSRE